MKEAWEGFSERMQRLNPLFSLGKGMDVGSLNPYVPTILLQVILELFYRELNDDENRRKVDIAVIVHDTIQEMKLSADDKQIDRITSGLLYQGQETLNKPFEAIFYNEETRTWDTQTFRYVTMDDLYTDLEKGGSIVYKLTDISQEMIFMSREMTKDFSITIEQLYSIQLIKNGNFKKATRNLKHLISKVNRLIAEERDFEKKMINDPKILVYEEHRQRENDKEKIESQFEEEKKHFKTITSLLERAQHTEQKEEVKNDLIELYQEIERARTLHDRYAKLLIQNIATEMKLKTDNPSLFWEKSMVSFRENIYENWFMKQGVQDFEKVENILSSLFSPQNDFVLPLDWIWQEQEFYETEIYKEVTEEVNEEEETVAKTITDWDSVVEAWEPIFDHLLQFGEYSMSELQEMPFSMQDLWFEESETFELWMMFDKKPLPIRVLQGNGSFNDERETLLYKLMKKSTRFKELEGKLIYTDYDHSDQPFQWYDTTITPFKLYLKENLS